MNNSTGKRREDGKEMSCAEFQQVLPDTFESGGSAREHDHLKTCEVCSDLVADLEYIAEQAKLLLPLRDPSPRVWNNIQNSLEREGLINAPRNPQPSTRKKPLTRSR